MPFPSIEKARDANFPVTVNGADLTLAQVNKLASIYDAIKAGGEAKEPMAVAIAQFKELYQKEGDNWVLRTKQTYTTLTDVEIFAEGDWKGDKYSGKDVDSLVNDTNAILEKVKPFVKLGHDDAQKLQQKEGLPALGWITKLKKKGKKVLADIKDVPKVLADLIQKGAYKRVSSEILWNFVEPSSNTKYPYILGAVAFLGADMPAVTNLKDIAALYELGGDVHTVLFAAKNGAIEMARGEGKGVGGSPQGDGGADICKCPECGKEVAHTKTGGGKSIPCADMTCPECGHKGMTGANKKPTEYSGLSDDEFGDPVNYRYPITKKYIQATMGDFKKSESREQYDRKEVGEIWTRIMRKVKAYGVNHAWNESLDPLLPSDLKSWAKGEKKLIMGGGNMPLTIIEQDGKQFVSVGDLREKGIDIANLPDVVALTTAKDAAEKKVTDLTADIEKGATQAREAEVDAFLTAHSTEKDMRFLPAEKDALRISLLSADNIKKHEFTVKEKDGEKKVELTAFVALKKGIEGRVNLADAKFKEFSKGENGEENSEGEAKVAETKKTVDRVHGHYTGEEPEAKKE